MRPDKDTWGLKLALVTATRATCCRRSVGCVLVDDRGQVLSTGYNGRAAGLPHCNESTSKDGDLHYAYACAGVNAPSGTNLEGCEAIHAEQNALLQCADVSEIHTAYVTTSPCVTCVKLLLNTGCQRIVFIDRYSHDWTAKELWDRGRGHSPLSSTWLHMPGVKL
jgi:dCMP deaminase